MYHVVTVCVTSGVGNHNVDLRARRSIRFSLSHPTHPRRSVPSGPVLLGTLTKVLSVLPNYQSDERKEK